MVATPRVTEFAHSDGEGQGYHPHFAHPRFQTLPHDGWTLLSVHAQELEFQRSQNLQGQIWSNIWFHVDGMALWGSHVSNSSCSKFITIPGLPSGSHLGSSGISPGWVKMHRTCAMAKMWVLKIGYPATPKSIALSFFPMNGQNWCWLYPILRHGHVPIRIFETPFPSNRCQVSRVLPDGGFLKWGYPQVIHFRRFFHYKHYPFWIITWGTIRTPRVITSGPVGAHSKSPASPWMSRNGAAETPHCSP